MKKHIIWFVIIAVVSCKPSEIEPRDIFVAWTGGIAKNGEYLPHQVYFQSQSFFVTENDIFFGRVRYNNPRQGFDGNMRIFKNEKVIFEETNNRSIKLHDIFANEKDWYATGSIYVDSLDVTLPVVWKNGTRTILLPVPGVFSNLTRM